MCFICLTIFYVMWIPCVLKTDIDTQWEQNLHGYTLSSDLGNFPTHPPCPYCVTVTPMWWCYLCYVLTIFWFMRSSWRLKPGIDTNENTIFMYILYSVPGDNFPTHPAPIMSHPTYYYLCNVPTIFYIMWSPCRLKPSGIDTNENKNFVMKPLSTECG